MARTLGGSQREERREPPNIFERTSSSVAVSGDAAQALARLGCSGRPRMSKNRA